jgi:hypothetical protein
MSLSSITFLGSEGLLAYMIVESELEGILVGVGVSKNAWTPTSM